jgi:hypothetical protein
VISWTDVTNLDAALADVPSGAQTVILADVYATLSAGRWGTKLDMAARYLAAHTGAIILRGAGQGAAGPITSERLGDASRSYADVHVAGAMNDLSATPWGMRFQYLVRGLGVWGYTDQTVIPASRPDDWPGEPR